MKKLRKKKRRTALPFSIIFRVILILSAGALCSSYLSIYINPKITSIPMLFGLYFVPLVIVNLLLLIAALVKRSGSAWIPFIILLPALFFGEMFFRWRDSTPGNQGKSVEICSYNVGMFSHQKGYGRVEQMERVAHFISKQNPDVVCLQEFFIKDLTNIGKSFPQYPYIYHHLYGLRSGSRFGNIILSRYPVTGSGKQTFKNSTNLIIYADLKVGSDTIRLYNCHLESNNISFTSLIKKISKTEDKSGEIIDLHDKIALTNKKRAEQVETLADSSAASPHPAVICGDFNDTPLSYTYHKLVKNKKDSFREAGKGFSATYSIFWPMLRIDYIFFPDIYWSASHRTVKVPYSDHYPVFSEIIIP